MLNHPDYFDDGLVAFGQDTRFFSDFHANVYRIRLKTPQSDSNPVLDKVIVLRWQKKPLMEVRKGRWLFNCHGQHLALKWLHKFNPSEKFETTLYYRPSQEPVL